MQIILEDFKAYDDFKNKQKRARTDVFFICKSIYILKVYLIEYINIEHWDKAQIFKKISFEQNKRYKMHSFQCILCFITSSSFFYEF